ncbi:MULTISPECIES: carbohydrate kinase family protein [Aestuariimicrobium]|uniref:carbohydrate kinase family protein n=1 Tax=Aestuariimicrobium TaxID=396388 RepID=UPI000479E475|nr:MULTISPECIES: carbohydrate kinase [Aestuariimicrobium]CAI9401466.1 Fructokinase [Aestuariimicrobium sp. T2.26MG-19.2B]
MQKRVLVLGEALIDVVVRPGVEPVEHPGGSPLNVAVGLARLDHGVDLATWFGRDDRGDRLHELIESSGVGLVKGSDDAVATPIALANVDDEGRASYVFELEWRLPELDAEQLAAYGHLHTGSFAATLAPGADEVARAVAVARDHATFSYDPNIRPALMGAPGLVRDRVEQLVAAADVVKVSDEDLAWLYPDTIEDNVIRDWAGSGPALVVVTRGPEPVKAMLARDGELRLVERPPVEVADTVGAGDSFMAGLVSALLDAGHLGSREAAAALRAASWDQLSSAVEQGIATSGITVGQAGAYAPTRLELV